MPFVAIDTNVLVYAEGLARTAADTTKVERARALIAGLLFDDSGLVLPVQVLAELHHVLRRKGGLPSGDVRARLERYVAGAMVVATDGAVLGDALALSDEHGLQTYDAIILAAAAHAGCACLYTEDMQDGFEWQGVRVVNPFA